MKKKFISSIAIAVVLAGTVGVTGASATTSEITLDMTSMTMPTVPALQTGDSITLKVTGLTGNQGIYASICKADVTSATKATLCDPDQAHMAWINAGGAMGSSSPVTGGTFPVTAAFQSVDCTVVACVIYVRADHLNTGDASLTRKIDVSFNPGGSSSTPDVVTGTAGGNVMIANVPHDLRYQTPITFDLETESGLPVTLTSLTDDCAVNGFVVTALTGSGVCAIGVTTTGNGTYAAVNINYPFYLKPAIQKISGKFPKVSKFVEGKSFTIKRSRFVSNMDDTVYVRSNSRKVCVVKTSANGWLIKAVAPGRCYLTASSKADPGGKWGKTEKKTSFTVNAKKSAKK